MVDINAPSTVKQRGFGHGGLRLVLLTLIAQQPRHGYDLIKAVEALTAGHYRPSAGMIYPLLNQLVEQALIQADSSTKLETKRQVYGITPQGEQFLVQESARVSDIFERVKQRAKQPVQVTRALENFKLALKLKLKEQVLSQQQANELVEILDDALQRIEQL